MQTQMHCLETRQRYVCRLEREKEILQIDIHI